MIRQSRTQVPLVKRAKKPFQDNSNKTTDRLFETAEAIQKQENNDRGYCKRRLFSILRANR